MAPPQFPVFLLTNPDPAVLTALGIPTTPSIPSLNTFKFSGTAGGSQSYFGTGGSFSFLSNANGFFDIVISRDGVNFDPTNPLNSRYTCPWRSRLKHHKLGRKGQ